MFKIKNSTPSECDQANHLWFCLRDYACLKMAEFLHSLREYIHVRTNRSELILVQTAHPVFEYKHVLSEARRILTLYLSKSHINKTLDELVGKQFPVVAREHIESLLAKFLIVIRFQYYFLLTNSDDRAEVKVTVWHFLSLFIFFVWIAGNPIRWTPRRKWSDSLLYSRYS